MSEDYRTPLSQWPTRSLNFVWGRILPHVLGVGRAGHHFFFVWGDQKSSWGRFFPSGDLFFRKYQRIKMCGDYGNIVWGSRKQLSVSVGTNKILCGVWGAPHTNFFLCGAGSCGAVRQGCYFRLLFRTIESALSRTKTDILLFRIQIEFTFISSVCYSDGFLDRYICFDLCTCSSRYDTKKF